MRLALIADPDVRERLKSVRAVASQTSLSAIGAASWDEVEPALEGPQPLALVVIAPPLPGAPPDVMTRLLDRTSTLVIVTDEPLAPEVESRGALRVSRPLSEETLVLLALRAGRQSSTNRMNFAPVDFLQMLCMSGDSHTLVVSRGKEDMGIIEVRGGAVWTAFDSLGSGEDAFARLIRPEMRVRGRPAHPSSKERTLFKGLNELLLESLRRIDEGSVPSAPPMSPESIEDALASPEDTAARVKQLHGEARSLMLSRKYDEAARVLLRLSELDPSSMIVRANLEQLRKLGYPK